MRLVVWIALAAGCSGDATDKDGGDKDGTDAPPVTVTAYEELPIASHFEWVDEEFEGGRLTTYMPSNPRAVLFAFHGTNGGVDTVLQTEWLELYNQLEV